MVDPVRSGINKQNFDVDGTWEKPEGCRAILVRVEGSSVQPRIDMFDADTIPPTVAVTVAIGTIGHGTTSFGDIISSPGLTGGVGNCFVIAF